MANDRNFENEEDATLEESIGGNVEPCGDDCTDCKPRGALPSRIPPRNRVYVKNLDLENRFTYHPPQPGQPEKYEDIRDTAKTLAYLISAECPNSREKSLALTKLEEAVMWANAAIAREQILPEEVK
jgi:hypothetical protein